VQIPLSVWEAGYNKDEELEADREGMRVAVLGGYSPYGAVTLFEKLAKLHKEYIIHAQSPEEELLELAIQSLEGYFRTHPQPSERLAQANALIAQEDWRDRKVQKPFRVEYESHNGQSRVKGSGEPRRSGSPRISQSPCLSQEIRTNSRKPPPI